jgi:hypothetical protein
MDFSFESISKSLVSKVPAHIADQTALRLCLPKILWRKTDRDRKSSLPRMKILAIGVRSGTTPQLAHPQV